jgi:hypothetical protein
MSNTSDLAESSHNTILLSVAQVSDRSRDIDAMLPAIQPRKKNAPQVGNDSDGNDRSG